MLYVLNIFRSLCETDIKELPNEVFSLTNLKSL